MTDLITGKYYRVNLFVPGIPAPQGSRRYFGNGRSVESSKMLPTWRHDIRVAAQDVMTKCKLDMFTGAVSIQMKFVMHRPVATPKGRTPHATKQPDLDKLARAVCDSLSQVVYVDDRQIVHIDAFKRIAEPNELTGVHLSIANLP